MIFAKLKNKMKNRDLHIGKFCIFAHKISKLNLS